MDDHKQELEELLKDESAFRAWLEQQPRDRQFSFGDADGPIEAYLDKQFQDYWHYTEVEDDGDIYLSYRHRRSDTYTRMDFPTWAKAIDEYSFVLAISLNEKSTAAAILAARENKSA